jgi:V/A-type H+-transporting ATPase subunit E
MARMEKLSEAILNKVRVEAQNIIKEAEEKAREEIQKAEKQRERRFEEEKRKLIEEASREAVRILAQASIKARQELLATKTEVINEVSDRVKNALSGTSSNEGALLNLIKEALTELGSDKAKIYVSPKDASVVQKILRGNKELANKIVEIEELDSLGGVIVEDIEAKVRIDNTYETRLEILLPKILPEISKALFETL